MSNEKVFFDYLLPVINFLGLRPKELNKFQKIRALLMFVLIYYINTCLVTIATFTNIETRLNGIEFVPISLMKNAEIFYFVTNSEKIFKIMMDWKIQKENKFDLHFLNGIDFAARINKILLSQLIPKFFVGPIRFLITKKSTIPIKVPDSLFGFLSLWIYQTCFIIYGQTVSYILDIVVYFNFSMMESYTKVVSDLIRNSSLRRTNEIYLEFLQKHKEFREVFAKIILMRGISMTVGCVLSVFKIINEHGVYGEAIGFLVFSTIMGLKFFIPCYLGSKIEHTTQKFLRDIYEIDWLTMKKSNKINLMITQECLKRPLRLSAVKVFHINLETFIRVLNFSFSSYAFLKHIHYSA
ncbi:hypothetical protein PVAND_000187 [Polypedilum vanderplanki]|uniref:Odorant receptor n=1 Tax=Polypedilum vanderplanki TaxID=319348 RepID=A0A9J6BJL0_POLVA|nr:hypothetical protein PVAND_000187 [Polypedilum vanderplanki]